MKSAIFLERDGILNDVEIRGHHQVTPARLEEFQLNKKAVQPLKKLKEAGFLLIATTNQPGISRGDLDRRELERMHDVLRKKLPLDAVYFCPYDESDESPCFKPATGLFREAAYEWGINLDHSFVVSDKWQDAKAAHNLGCYSVLLNSPWIGDVHHDFLCDTLDQICGRILEIQQAQVTSIADRMRPVYATHHAYTHAVSPAG